LPVPPAGAVVVCAASVATVKKKKVVSLAFMVIPVVIKWVGDVSIVVEMVTPSYP